MEVEVTEFERQLNVLLEKEKESRLRSDANESVKVVKAIATLCFEQNEHDKFNEVLVAICKKRGQAKKAQIELVAMAMIQLHKLPVERKLRLIDAIMEVCEKKIYLEVEYARCVLLLTKFKEDDNQIADAAKILQEVQVETYGSMDKREKLEFILYQMKIMIKKLDYVRLFIISKKIEPKNIEDEAIADLKLIYYSYLVFYYRHENKYMECAEAYLRILETIHKRRDLEVVADFGFSFAYENILQNYIMYLTISQWSKDKIDQLQQAKEKYLYSLDERSAKVINDFLGAELISTNINDYGVTQFELFIHGEYFESRLKEFRRQLIHHNLRVFQIYYDAISLQRMSELIAIDIKEIEEEVCILIDQKLLQCKIDRLSGVVDFQLKTNENNILDAWGSNINKVLDLIELTSNLIKREEEIYL